MHMRGCACLLEPIGLCSPWHTTRSVGPFATSVKAYPQLLPHACSQGLSCCLSMSTLSPVTRNWPWSWHCCLRGHCLCPSVPHLSPIRAKRLRGLPSSLVLSTWPFRCGSGTLAASSLERPTCQLVSAASSTSIFLGPSSPKSAESWTPPASGNMPCTLRKTRRMAKMTSVTTQQGRRPWRRKTSWCRWRRRRMPAPDCGQPSQRMAARQGKGSGS
mmetsp:Transcript_95621/g.270387  ORF Transcript_95621/g.270387 Transcript_95621/m.270387 type:complete len:216 (-) Transcript_95621:2112-2759(-)